MPEKEGSSEAGWLTGLPLDGDIWEEPEEGEGRNHRDVCGKRIPGEGVEGGGAEVEARLVLSGQPGHRGWRRPPQREWGGLTLDGISV